MTQGKRLSQALPPSGILCGPDHLVLQRLTLPDPDITDQQALFLRCEGDVLLDAQAAFLAPQSALFFDTYVNLFDLTHWQTRCNLQGLWLCLRGEGKLRLTVRDARGSRQSLFQRDVVLSSEGVLIDLEAAIGLEQGLLAVHMQALDAVRLEGGDWLTLPQRQPENPCSALRLAVIITTYQREAAVARTIKRITSFLEQTGSADSTHLFVVDNGRSLDIPDHPCLTVLPNRNLGGAGGFARGLAAAQDGSFSHAVFMDDDATFQMENLVRTMAFLSLAKNPAAAVAGAMISQGRPFSMWENGAVFDRFCRPCHHGVDLRKPDEVVPMLEAATGPKPAGFYGGWWFFAFPLAHVAHYPFPFFVRGDDISFSLAHAFEISTLNGVMSFQEDFAVKESPQTLYLDLRNHLHHHLTHDALEIGRGATAWLAVRFVLRSLVRMHYDSAAAQLLAWSDVMSGPEFFAQNVDMIQRRKDVRALTGRETWHICPPEDYPAPVAAKPPGLLRAYGMKLTLNGHLIPGFGWIGRRIVLSTRDRAPLWPLWGARSVRYVDDAHQRTYEVHHAKGRFFGLMWRLLKHVWRWNRDYTRLRQSYRQAYPHMTSRSFWQAHFEASDPEKRP